MVFAFAGDSTITKFFAIYSFLTKHLPGSALASSQFQREQRAVSSEIGSLLLSNSQSTCAGLSGVNNLKTHVSDEGESFGYECQPLGHRRLFIPFTKRRRQKRRSNLLRQLGGDILPLLHQLRSRAFIK